MAITRRAEDAAPLRVALQALGAVVHVVPCIALQPLRHSALSAVALARAGRATHVAFASRMAAWALAKVLAARDLTLRQGAHLVAVGPATARAVAHALGAKVYARAPTARTNKTLKAPSPISAGCAAVAHAAVTVVTPHSAEGLARYLVAATAGRDAHVLLPTAVAGRTLVAEALMAVGVVVTRLPVYETISLSPCRARDVLPATLHYVLFASPSSVDGWAQLGLAHVRTKYISIGPATSAALRAHGLPVHGQASVHNVEGLLTALMKVHHAP